MFGAGVALTLDEFALILRLQDVYWTAEGRLSVDAVIVAVSAGLLIVLGFHPAGTSSAGLAGSAAAAVVVSTIVVNLCFAVVCLMKGKYWTGFFGIFVPILGIIGAIRVARPTSPWAHRRYGKKPKRLAKAQRREDHVNATWRAWREAFFDLIAGKPHLPSAPAVAQPGGASAVGAVGRCRGGGAGVGRGGEGRRDPVVRRRRRRSADRR